jgi:organic radical activating enzyme
MPQPHTLKIAEIFPSVQGEGLRQGEPTIFVRLSGCNLRCPFCDTKYAWEEGRGMTVERVKDRIKALRKRFPAEWVCLTGGEPMLQDLGALVRGLKADGLKIQVETNGTVFGGLAADWVTVSPKPEKFAVHPRFRRLAKEVKLVVTRDLAFATVRRLRECFPATTPLLLQPESNASWSAAKGLRLIGRCRRNGLENVRLSVQLHRVFRLR